MIVIKHKANKKQLQKKNTAAREFYMTINLEIKISNLEINGPWEVFPSVKTRRQFIFLNYTVKFFSSFKETVLCQKHVVFVCLLCDYFRSCGLVCMVSLPHWFYMSEPFSWWKKMFLTNVLCSGLKWSSFRVLLNLKRRVFLRDFWLKNQYSLFKLFLTKPNVRVRELKTGTMMVILSLAQRTELKQKTVCSNVWSSCFHHWIMW